MISYYKVEKGELPGSHNPLFYLRHNILPGLWVAKISEDLSSAPRRNCLGDLSHRGLLAYKLSKLVGTPIPKTKIIYLNQIRFDPNLNMTLNQLNKTYSKDGILISKFEGVSLGNYLKMERLEKIANLDEIVLNSVFNLWIGNYDKKDGDYVVTQSGKAYSIDYNLSGPGGFEDTSLSLGENAYGYSFRSPNHVGFCIGPSLLKHVKEKARGISFFKPIIAKIESTKREDIENVFSDLSIKNKDGENINDLYINFLTLRASKGSLKNAIESWIKEGYPRIHDTIE